jgi:CRP-like cAMP-binding protein
MRALTEHRFELPMTYLTEGMGPDEIGLIEEIAEVRCYTDGEKIIQHRATDSDLMVLLSGKAQIVSHVGDPMAEIVEGQVFGEIALIDKRPRSANVVSIGETEVIVIPGELLLALIETHPALGCKMMTNLSRVLCQRLRKLNSQLGTLLALAT